jgi:hypothetical protein
MTSTLDNVASVASQAITVLEPIVSVLVPGAGPAITIAGKIIQGFLDNEPTAVALYNQIVSGTPVTADQLQAYVDKYHADDDKLNADLEAAKARATS